MCGIVGFLTSRAQNIPDVGVLREMRESLSHRGPDDWGNTFGLSMKEALSSSSDIVV